MPKAPVRPLSGTWWITASELYGSGTESVADLSADFLHELYTLDKPWFAECPAWDHWWLNEPVQGEALPLGEPAEALRLAASIKELARSGKHQVSADLLSQAGKTSLSRYLTSRLLRNPLDDATRAAREFIAASRDRSPNFTGLRKSFVTRSRSSAAPSPATGNRDSWQAFAPQDPHARKAA